MTLIAPRLTLLMFPQRYDGERLHVRLLLVPRQNASWNGSPLEPLISSFPNAGDRTPALADADLQFEARFVTGLGMVPTNAAAAAVSPLPQASGVVATARPLFESLVAPLPGRFRLSPGMPRLAKPVSDKFEISKWLPRSYRKAFVFTGPTARGAVTDDSYHCAMRAKTTPNLSFVESPDTVSWGKVIAFAMRQPRLAMRLGLVREASFAVSDALVTSGGFVYASLARGSAYAEQVASQFSFISHYAARIPAMAPGVPRQLFAAVQFPVLYDDPAVPGPPASVGNYDRVFVEAADYDDGFAKIVHGMQPVSVNLLAEDADGVPPVHDIGIRVAWDDEQILTWQNRQVLPDPGIAPKRLDAPMGVFGYRIDARRTADDPWRSLVRVRPRAPLMLDATRIDTAEESESGLELAVEVHPMQIDGNQASGRWWLPAYMSQWNGQSLVLPDVDAAALFHTESAGASLARQYEAVGLEEIPLRYGASYQLRVRLMDLSGGGPGEDDNAIHESPAPVATVPFRRHVVPEPVRLEELPAFMSAVAADDDPVVPLFQGDTLRIARPRLGYPSVVFTGKYADPIPLLQAASDRAVSPDAAGADREASGIPDPDVQRLTIDVEVRALKMDNGLSSSGRDAWALLYSTTRTLPADMDATRELALRFRDANVLRFGDVTDLGDFGATAKDIDELTDELPLPTARDVRITIRATADEDAAYWAPGAHIGKPVQVIVRRASRDERGLIANDSDARKIRALWLRPDAEVPAPAISAIGPMLFQRMPFNDTPSVMARLAEQLELDVKGMTLVGRRGERVAFACSRRIRHTLAPDASSLTLGARDDLVNHWVVGMTLRLDRDWTWEGLRHIGLHIFREGSGRLGPRQQVGEWEIIQTASLQALHGAERTYTRLIFLDAVDAQVEPVSKVFPDTIDVSYTVEPRFRVTPVDGADDPEPIALHLPVTTPPVQVPRLAAAGLALSKYERNASYSSSEPRRRSLWLEFDRPPADPNDTYFIRLLAYAADPLLSDHRVETLLAPEEPALNIDAESMRSITPGQSDDNAGLAAMVPLTPGNSPVHFLVPIPPGMTPDGPEMFGLFTCELRVGHIGIWSTAQGRFGRPLRSTGMQYPAPTLLCTTTRTADRVVVEAPYAQAVLGGRNITANPPRTQIWALLYAQVRQADDKDTRNVLLDDRVLVLRPRTREGRILGGTTKLGGSSLTGSFENSDAPARAVTSWTAAEIRIMLASIGLPDDSPLSVLCVEMMPTMAALANRSDTRDSLAGANIAALAFAERSGVSSPAVSAGVGTSTGPRPLSDGLGHFRILRTSPLAPVPHTCCADC